jgi:phosphodiesterase/alkaline phosphatase D-like protein
MYAGHRSPRDWRRTHVTMAVLALLRAAAVVPAAPAPVGFSGTFEHGVASGDPLPGQVIIWTRVTPRAGDAGAIPVGWAVTLSSAQHQRTPKRIVNGTVEANAASDFTGARARLCFARTHTHTHTDGNNRCRH